VALDHKGRWSGVTSDEEVYLAGSVGGAVRIGDTVHRPTGPWTAAVHALLGYLAPRVPGIPRVLGYGERGREVLSYLPGRVIDDDNETLSTGQLVSAVQWTRAFHDAVAGFSHPGPWRFFPVADASLIGHNDIAPYNVCFEGDQVVGVIDWDMAGPTTPRLELAFIAWNWVPLWRDIGPKATAERLQVIAAAYGGPDAHQILHTVPHRIQAGLDWIPAAAAAGDEGMAHIMTLGEPGLSGRALEGLIQRIPAIDQQLG
jgi:Phosphotransferase enzyme family